MPGTGTIFYDGSVRRFLDLFATYIGGYILEDKVGGILTMPYSYPKVTEPTVMIDSALDIDAGSLQTYLRDGLVRNVITMSHVGVTLAPEQDLATVMIVLPAGTPEVIYTAQSLDRTALDIEWTAPAANAIPGATVRAIAGDASAYSFGVTANAAVDTIFTVRGRPWRQTSGNQRTSMVSDSVDDYDERPLPAPPWYNADTFAFGEQWILDQAGETRYTRLTLPRWQQSAAANAAVDALQAGMLVDLSITTPQDEPIADRALIVGAELQGSANSVPRLVLHLINVEAVSVAGNTWGQATWGVSAWG